MKINRSLLIVVFLAGSSIFATRYADYQFESCNSCPYSNNPRTSEVYRPTSYDQRRVPLDYHTNEYNKRLPSEHFTYDPEEAGMTRR